MSKTIIVTGGAGFIGSNFVFHMLDKYCKLQYQIGHFIKSIT
jgi:dTDP-D-glucose 4,6-dehydratase